MMMMMMVVVVVVVVVMKSGQLDSGGPARHSGPEGNARRSHGTHSAPPQACTQQQTTLEVGCLMMALRSDRPYL